MGNYSADYSIFMLAFAASAAAPGPEIAALVGRALAGGLRATLPLAAGIIAGKLLMLGAALLGLAALVGVLGPLFAGLKVLGLAYLLYLGLRKWNNAGRPVAAGARTARTARTTSAGGLSELALGLAMTLSNPVALMFYLALLPAVVDVSAVNPRVFIVLCCMITGIMAAIVLAYGCIAELARKLFAAHESKAMIDRIAAAMMVGAALLIALR
ncbi:MAG: LysE family transporter [Pseudomonadota bacterium]